VQRLALRLQFPDPLVEVTLARAARAQEYDLRLALLRARGDGNRLLVDLQPDKQCAPLCQG
jgi:hypothetical protein